MPKNALESSEEIPRLESASSLMRSPLKALAYKTNAVPNYIHICFKLALTYLHYRWQYTQRRDWMTRTYLRTANFIGLHNYIHT